MQSRRKFIGNVASGVAGTLATGKLLASDRVRVGVIGAGERGSVLAREIGSGPEAQVAAIADVYVRRLEEAGRLAPGARLYRYYQDLLEDTSIDAVVIATPQHLHTEPFLAALGAGKHVYCERAMALTFDQARRMRTAAVEAAAKCRVVEIGHQHCSSGQLADVRNWMAAGAMGQVTAISARAWRNTPNGKPLWTRPVYPDMTTENVDWTAFLGAETEPREFDAKRFVNWRLYGDYSGGSVHEAMSQQLAFWYRALELGIPWSVTMTGGLFRWKDGREVPDTVNVSMVHAEEMLFHWESGAGSNHPGVTEEVLGTDGTIVRGQQLRYTPQRVNRPAGVEMTGETGTAPRAHVANFLAAVKDGREPACGVEVGYRVAVACAMALESYRLGRTVYWDFEKEEIV